MNSNPFEVFIAFVNFDQELERLIQQSYALSEKKSHLEALIFTQKNNFEAERQRVHELKKAVDRLELEVKDLRQQEKNKQSQLDTVSSSKEYMSLEHELKTLRKKYEVTENQLIEQWQEYETAQEVFNAQAVTFEQTIAQHEQEAAAIHQELQKIQQEVERYQTERATRIALVNQEWRELYERMKGSVPNPVVPVKGNACSGCGYIISAQDLSSLRRHKLINCKECFRILYFDEQAHD